MQFRKNRDIRLKIKHSLFLWCALAGLITLGTLTLWGCGKLSDDSNRSSSPVGVSGGVPIPITPQTSVGTHTLTLYAEPSSLEADLTNYAVLKAQLEDSSGRAVENFSVKFTTSGNIGWFYDSTSSSFIDNDTSFTDSTGLATTRLYGSRSGEAVIQASIDLEGDGVDDLMTSVMVTMLSSGQPSSAGNYTLTLKTYPDTIPADLATYSTVVARLVDSTGGSVENFNITFNAELGYLENDAQGPSTLSTSVTAVTDRDGGASVYFYGAREGSATLSASVAVSDLVGTLQAKTTIIITEGPGVPGTGITGVELTADTYFKEADAEDTGLAAVEAFNLTANVWDATGDPVADGVRVEFSVVSGSGGSGGSVTSFSETVSGAAAALFSPGSLPPGTYTYTVRATVIIDGKEYTDDVNLTVTVRAGDSAIEIVLSVVPEEKSIETGQTATVTARVSVNGAVSSGIPVLFATTLGAVSPTNTTTNASGIAVTTLSAGSTPGTATVYATVTYGGSTANQSVDITITERPAVITASTPGTTTLTLGTTTTVSTEITATATVKDTNKEFLSGATVSFSVTENCSNISLSPTSLSATTNDGGLAEYTFTATATATGTCSYTVRAVASTVESTATGTITVN